MTRLEFARILRALLHARDGNFSLLFALTLPVMLVAVGTAIDYSRAAEARTALSGIADAAALLAVQAQNQKLSDSVVQAQALAFFTAQAPSVNGVGACANCATVTIAHPNGPTSRSATVAFSTSFASLFGAFVGMPSMAIGGSSTAQTSQNPNVNFFVLADSSPSMALVATSAGVAQLQNFTIGQLGAAGGCAFACHEQRPDLETGFANPYWNPASPSQNCAMSGGKRPAGCVMMDDYQYAHSLGLTLRTDNLVSGLQAVATTMTAAASTNQAIDSLDMALNVVSPLATPTAAASAAQAIAPLLVYKSGQLTQSGPVNANGAATNAASALASLNSALPNPGQGSNAIGDTPQEFVILITDGVENDSAGVGLLSKAGCDALKNRGVRIGVVYTTYYAAPAWPQYQSLVQPVQGQIGPNLQACASSPLYYAEVPLDGDIGAALKQIVSTFTASTTLTH
jgi:Flp pilus assembly protein TadG